MIVLIQDVRSASNKISKAHCTVKRRPVVRTPSWRTGHRMDVGAGSVALIVQSRLVYMRGIYMISFIYHSTGGQ